jgi:hypothetical protein
MAAAQADEGEHPTVPHGSRPGVTPTSKCVSGYEFEHIRNGTPRAEAERFLDGPGRFWDGNKNLAIYRSCAGSWREAQVGVKYVGGRVFWVSGTRIVNGTLIAPPKA